MDPASRQRPPDWYLSWMTGPAKTQIDNRKEACGELIAALTSSNESSFDADTLRDLIDILNHEFICLKLGSSLNPDDFPIVLSRAWGDRLLNILSDCLVKSLAPTAYLERELQCRALFTTIALLNAQGVPTLHDGFYDNFYSSLQKRFEDLQWQAGTTGDLTYAKFCKVQCSYLLSAVKEFASHFQKSDPLVVTASSRVLSTLTFAASAAAPAAGGAINLQAALRQLNEAFKDVSHKPEKRYLVLFSLQELTITIQGLQLYQKMTSVASSNPDLTSEASKRAERLIPNTLKAILNILMEHDKWERDKFENYAHPPAEFWQKYVLTTLKRGPPSFNLYYYFYGLVDCAAQIAKVVEPTALPPELGIRLRRAALLGEEATHRWKALEYLVSAEPNRAKLQNALLADAPKNVRTRFVNEITYVSSVVSGDVAKYPLPPSSSGPDEKSHKKMIIHPSSYIEPEFPLASITPFCNGVFISSNQLPKTVLSAGLSPDCQAAFWLNKDLAVAFSLVDLRDSAPVNLLASHHKDKLDLRQSAISNKYFVTISSQELIVTAYSHTQGDAEGVLIGRLRLGKASDGSVWVPRCLDIHDTPKRSWIAIAGETTVNGVTCGMVEVYSVFEGPKNYLLGRHDSSLMLAAREVLKGDLIKSIAFSPSGGRLACVTNNNRVMVWQLSNNLRPRSDPFVLRHKTTTEPDVRGMTSATIFQSHSSKLYILGTTWPSSERVKNGGEWCFISPLAAVPADVPRKLFHKLQDLGEAGPFIAGAASPNGEMIALLERSGNIYVAPLAKNDDGGLRSWDIIKLEQQKNFLHRQDDAIPASLRFAKTENGLELFVLKRNGALVRKNFDGFQGQTLGRSPRPSELAGVSEDPGALRPPTLRRSSRDGSEVMESLSAKLESSSMSRVNSTMSRVESSSLHTPEETPSEIKSIETATRCEVLGKEQTLAIVADFPRHFSGENSSTSSSLRKSSAEQSDSQESNTDSTTSNPSISFHKHLTDLQDLEQHMIDFTELLHFVQKDDKAGCWKMLSVKTPSIEGMMSSLQDVYEWVAYLHDTNQRALDGLLALQEMNIIDDTITILLADNGRDQVVRVLPVTIGMAETMHGFILESLEVLNPHMDDPREADWGVMFDALAPLKKVWDRMSAALELGLPLNQDSDIPSQEQLEGLQVMNEMIIVGLISYTRSHTSSFLQAYMDERFDELRLKTSRWTMRFCPTVVRCLEPLLQTPLWVFKIDSVSAIDAVPRASQNQPNDEDVYLSTTILDFADLWGPARLVHQGTEDEIISEIDWPGGTLRAQLGNYANQPRTINDEIRCYGLPWSKVGSAEDMGPVKFFDCTKRLLIS